ncbi:hypothetical protein GO003_019700 [Methylicorpusculum oleiharenae]|uniref:hypothetical protein n=1 Tax=Methylicorpusculum oleiharenae TaxID=1338687 RepID=UPI00135874FC|nr:hypothetical protein [Methylicorpusculum oleiharenae]MCD2452611.1 hypothetical protein [Methylicorpusculum oleiharenae]
MSNEENTPQEDKASEAVEKSQAALGKFTDTLLKLKEDQPKIFYGGLSVIGLLIVISLFSGGSSSTVSGPVIKDLQIGQKYVLKGPNATDPNASIRLVAVPGTIAAYDDTEEDDRSGGCKHMPQGTPVSVEGFQDAYGKKNAFVNVKILSEGECSGQTAWTLAINVQ